MGCAKRACLHTVLVAYRTFFLGDVKGQGALVERVIMACVGPVSLVDARKRPTAFSHRIMADQGFFSSFLLFLFFFLLPLYFLVIMLLHTGCDAAMYERVGSAIKAVNCQLLTISGLLANPPSSGTESSLCPLRDDGVVGQLSAPCCYSRVASEGEFFLAKKWHIGVCFDLSDRGRPASHLDSHSESHPASQSESTNKSYPHSIRVWTGTIPLRVDTALVQSHPARFDILSLPLTSHTRQETREKRPSRKSTSCICICCYCCYCCYFYMSPYVC
ncbi:hypothetical protein EDB81DRAFT_57991 [Dactylonectria macrodidyma]|uniref:Uncharacterized protein n=1 Tax=Dactylonectria macrodidyma TaxID=307937 RepID=A0A9P9EMM6_9HYPO|nr:hypothetical protein EDB81DRAFT_57991 [Dactylonectria macrodidyma]